MFHDRRRLGAIQSKFVAAAAYIGPGDLTPGATSWFGLRGYSAAYAASNGPAIDIVKASDGTALQTINILTDGTLDVATIAALGYAVKIKKIYDQSGNGRHFSQATLSNMPDFAPNIIGSRPAMQFAVGNNQNLAITNFVAVAQNFSVSWVGRRTSNTAAYNSVFSVDTGGAGTLAGFDQTSGNVMIYGGSTVVTAPATENVFHAVQNFYSSTASTITVDLGAPVTVNPGTNGLTTGAATIGTDPFSRGVTGYINEVGVWSGAVSASLGANQKSYWGF